MKTETFSSTVSTAYGETLTKPVPYSGSYEAFESAEEVAVKYTKTELDDLIKSAANAAQKANAKSKASTAALEAAGISKPDPNSNEVLEANMVKNLMKRKGLDEETAKQIVSGLMTA
jgi:hypothetical protein